MCSPHRKVITACSTAAFQLRTDHFVPFLRKPRGTLFTCPGGSGPAKQWPQVKSSACTCTQARLELRAANQSTVLYNYEQCDVLGGSAGSFSDDESGRHKSAARVPSRPHLAPLQPRLRRFRQCVQPCSLSRIRYQPAFSMLDTVAFRHAQKPNF